MLLQEKMKNTKFSPSEEIVIDFILTTQKSFKYRCQSTFFKNRFNYEYR